MNAYQNHPSLLPNGLLDLLQPQAEKEAQAIASFMKDFAAFGYQRVKPPLVEFEESLLSGPGQALARNTFRMMDPLSQRMMGVRADVTAQIARLATSRLGDDPRPLRLSYAADVLRVNGTQLRPERQFCQVGCELIGVDSVLADTEIALIALKALSGAGIEQLSIDLTVPTLIHHLYEETETSVKDRALLDDLIEKRDADAMSAQKGGAAQVIYRLMACEGTADRVVAALSTFKLPSKAEADIQKLVAVAKELKDALSVYGLGGIQITIDPLERRGFEYQTGISFTLFSGKARGELGRGGRYDVAGVNGASETASGFTLYMDTILKVLPAWGQGKVRILEANAGWADLKKVQDQGDQAALEI